MNKMFNVILRKFKEQRKSFMYYAIGLVLYSWMIIALFPFFTEGLDLDSYVQAFPESMMVMLGVEEATSMNTIEGFLSLEYLAIFFVLILTFFIASSAGATIAGAVEKKIMDFQLSQPISRSKLLLSEAIATICYAIGLVLINSIAIILFTKFYSVGINTSGILAFTIMAIGMMLSIYGIAILLSSFLRSRTLVMTSTVFLILAMHIFQSLTMIVDKLEGFKKVTLFYMYNPEKTLATGNIEWIYILTFLLIFTVGLLLSVFVFNKKEIS
jgi:ABC-2 type transport system permease protein